MDTPVSAGIASIGGTVFLYGGYQLLRGKNILARANQAADLAADALTRPPNLLGSDETARALLGVQTATLVDEVGKRAAMANEQIARALRFGARANRAAIIGPLLVAAGGLAYPFEAHHARYGRFVGPPIR